MLLTYKSLPCRQEKRKINAEGAENSLKSKESSAVSMPSALRLVGCGYSAPCIFASSGPLLLLFSCFLSPSLRPDFLHFFAVSMLLCRRLAPASRRISWSGSRFWRRSPGSQHDLDGFNLEFDDCSPILERLHCKFPNPLIVHMSFLCGATEYRQIAASGSA